MSRRQKYPLRPLSGGERRELDRLSRSHSEPASHVARAKALVAVAQGPATQLRPAWQGARQAMQCRTSCGASTLRGYKPWCHAMGGPQMVYGPAERERILAAARRQPDRERDGTATWSVTSLRRALRTQGMPQSSTYTIWHVLTAAGLRWQHNRTWCATGTVWRKRKGRLVVVHDPDTEAKKN